MTNEQSSTKLYLVYEQSPIYGGTGSHVMVINPPNGPETMKMLHAQGFVPVVLTINDSDHTDKLVDLLTRYVHAWNIQHLMAVNGGEGMRNILRAVAHNLLEFGYQCNL